MEKLYEVTFKNGETKKMTEAEIRASRILTDTFVDLVFRLQLKEGIFHHETGINYKRIG